MVVMVVAKAERRKRNDRHQSHYKFSGGASRRRHGRDDP
jgi:hypothetical protein